MLSEKMESLKVYLEDESNYSNLLELIENIHWETGYLDWLIVHSIEYEFDDIFNEYSKNEIARLIERNINTFTIEDDFFRMDMYGELISYTEEEYKNMVYDDLDYVIDSISNLKIYELENIADNMKYEDKYISKILLEMIENKVEG